MDIRIITTVKELKELGLFDAYFAKFQVAPLNDEERITLTLEQAHRIGWEVTVGQPAPVEAPKKKTRKAKA